MNFLVSRACLCWITRAIARAPLSKSEYEQCPLHRGMSSEFRQGLVWPIRSDGPWLACAPAAKVQDSLSRGIQKIHHPNFISFFNSLFPSDAVLIVRQAVIPLEESMFDA